MGVGLNHTAYLFINISLGCEAVFSLEWKKRQLYFHNLAMTFSTSKNIIFKGRPILYTCKQNYICDYNHICIMPNVLMFDYIIMNIIRNKVLEYYSESADSYFANIENNRICINRGSLQEFYWKKGTHESLDFPCPKFNV